MQPSLTIVEVEKIAALARLELTDDEKEAMVHDLAEIVGYVQRLSEVDTRRTDAYDHEAVPLKLLREDSIDADPDAGDLVTSERFEEHKLVTKGVFIRDHDA